MSISGLCRLPLPGLVCLLFLFAAASASAGLFYPGANRLEPSPDDEQLSCAELDKEITALFDQTYSNRPGLYEDPLNGVAFWVGSLHYWPVAGLGGYSAVLGHLEKRRIHGVERRVELLRRLKSRRHCFEQ